MSTNSSVALTRRIPSLDGLRALAIALVLCAHAACNWQPRGFDKTLFQAGAFQLGDLGVRVFFVISGFLITGLLRRELERDNRIHLPRFYFARSLRIFPAYYAFLLGIALLSRFRGDLAPDQMARAAFYVSNYHVLDWNLRHTWSLSVEEQFYLLWPAVLCVCGIRRGFWLAGALLVLCPIARIFFIARYGGIGVHCRFECVSDALATGCLLSVVAPRLQVHAGYRKFIASRGFWSVPIAVLALSCLALPIGGPLPLLFYGPGLSVQNVMLAACIHAAIVGADSRVGRLLNARPLTIIGTMSYSLYLWQQPFLNPDAPLLKFPLNIFAIALLAALSYYGIEQPCLRWRARMMKRTPKLRPRTLLKSPS